MSKWGAALGQAVGAVARVGSEAIDTQMKTDASIAAEQRAADLRLSTAERLMEAERLMKNRAAERFSKVVQNKVGGGMNADDAAEAALGETLASDPEAYQAGTGMLGSVLKDKAATKQQDSRERIAANALESRERIERERAEQRERSEQKRMEVLLARIAGGGGGKGGKDNKTALRQNVELLKELGYTPDKIEAFIFDKKGAPVEDIAIKLLAADKKDGDGEMTPQQAAVAARELVASMAPPPAAKPAPAAAAAGKSAAPAVKTLPAGAKQIGTSKGKPVYQTPDGKRFVQD